MYLFREYFEAKVCTIWVHGPLRGRKLYRLASATQQHWRSVATSTAKAGKESESMNQRLPIEAKRLGC